MKKQLGNYSNSGQLMYIPYKHIITSFFISFSNSGIQKFYSRQQSKVGYFIA